MTRSHSVSIVSTRVYSSHGNFRYSLTRCWDPRSAKLLFVMCNPSKATEVLNDETVMACQNVAWLIGHPDDRNGVISELIDQLPCFGAICVCNVYPAIGTSAEAKRTPPSELNENDCVIAQSCRWADWVICAWGTGVPEARARSIEQIVRSHTDVDHVLCFGLTAMHHQPRHPIGVKTSADPEVPGRISLDEKLLRALQPWEAS